MTWDAARLVQTLAHSATLMEIRAGLAADQIIRQAVNIQQIAAPTFAEERRAALVQEQFVALGLRDVSIDRLFNVYGRWPGENSAQPALLISAHTDTVFPLEADLSLHYEAERIYGPGLGDNSLGVAALLALPAFLSAHHLRPAVDLWFVANTREEGLGDLGGMRLVWDQLGARLGAALVIEGMALGRIYHAGIAVRRLRITCRVPGGHSWLNFGQPSAVHGLIELGAHILAIVPPGQPRTTYNIGLIEGGQSVNSLATSAVMLLDLRSEAPVALAALERQVRAAVDILSRPELKWTVEVVGDRPAGQLATRHPLVQLAAAALTAIDHSVTYEAGSTDANILLANGLPAVTVGVAHGGNAHRPDEYIETTSLADGIWHLLLLTLSTAQALDAGGWAKQA